MVYRITSETDFLRAELYSRETAEQAREFFGLVAESAARLGQSRILISVRASSAVFTVERSGFLVKFKSVAGDPAHRLALVADSEELNHSHEYLELLGRRQGINVRHFRDEPAALTWVRSTH